MRYLLIGILFILIGCNKQNFHVVTYHLEHSGYGELEYSINGGEHKFISNASFDTTFMLPVIDYKYEHRIGIGHYNSINNESYVKAYIKVNNEIDEYEKYYNSCYSDKRILILIK